MTIDTLMKQVAPPVEASGAFDGPWAPVEAEIGLVLPTDYKDYVKLYGAGRFLEFLGLYIPRAENPNMRLERMVRVVCEGLTSLSPLEEPPYPYWPTPGGLLPFGATDNGDELFWLTRGAAEDWKVVIMDRAFGRFETFDCGVAEFLAGLIRGEIEPEGFPDDLLPSDCPCMPSAAQAGSAEPRWAMKCSTSWRADWRRW